jgi:hypothetical protein
MSEGHRLRHLQVGKAGHDGVRFTLGQVEQAALQSVDLVDDEVDLLTQIEPDIGRNLVIA